MHIWTKENWKSTYLDNCNIRSGLRLRFDKDVDNEVKRACKEFCTWLRQNYIFPIRIPVYIKNKEKVRSRDGGYAFGTFFGPYDMYVEPLIRVAAGDYKKRELKDGKDNALASILFSIAHELTHYYQWINNLKLTEIGEERQATMYARCILDDYAKKREHP